MNPKSAPPPVTLNDGRRIPQLGIGMWQVPPGQVAPVLKAALEAGYRSIDTASAYQNEAAIGEALRAAPVPRGQLFVTTKLWNSDHGADRAPKALEESLARLGLAYVDLYLIHWPLPSRNDYVDTWKALIRLRDEGRAKSIGVSNFTPSHLRRIIDATGIVPAVNQVELHPRFSQAALRAFHAGRGIVTESWSPLAQGGSLLQDPLVEKIAAKHKRTPAQVILRWHIELDLVVIPKSVTPERIAENAAIFDFTLDPGDMASLAKLNNGHRIGPDPDTFAMI
ncbi:MAG: aldo/keto reductase [Opitutaceae bacterium]|jgi:diketogulonate reductase-like aldo/keto reductase|nr:aldo/keto reductase [Opitutaceae bacterium]